jgi:hypothetical protein
MNLPILTNFRDIKFPCIQFDLDNISSIKRNTSSIEINDKYVIYKQKDLISAFPLTQLDLPPTKYIFYNPSELILMNYKHSNIEYIIDSRYNIFSLAKQLIGRAQIGYIEEINGNYVIVKNVPHYIELPLTMIPKDAEFEKIILANFDEDYYALGLTNLQDLKNIDRIII